ncbi:uncharacterized protein LOC119336657 isoform X2 [Triticum dicoccoides]|uniref:uncharacterized protein LOC119336657 isoform X2 n=1 Tax=Triticum dicoccoides TaxID=85692 RepID=UPI001891EFA6|nr:uncharacterized protein LOC119336657 isoform X2 [Triticum dicoccoides]
MLKCTQTSQESMERTHCHAEVSIPRQKMLGIKGRGAHAGYLAGWLGIGLRVEVKGEMGDKFPKRLGLNTMNLMLGMCFISKTRCWAAKRSDLDKH